MKVKTIGKIQFFLGCFLLISIIFSSFFISEKIYVNKLENGIDNIIDEWKNVVEKSNETDIDIAGHLVSDTYILASIYLTTWYVFMACIIIAGILSIILILQGLVNINRN